MSDKITEEMVRRLDNENLFLASTIALSLFVSAPLFSKIKRTLRCDLKIFTAELERRNTQ